MKKYNVNVFWERYHINENEPLQYSFVTCTCSPNFLMMCLEIELNVIGTGWIGLCVVLSRTREYFSHEETPPAVDDLSGTFVDLYLALKVVSVRIFYRF